jgi:general secretion pathway protein N
VLICAAGLTAVCVLPARWIMAWVPASAPVTVVDAQGRLWDAHATLAIGVGPLRRSLPDPVHWRLRWDGGPVLVLSHPWLAGPLEIRPVWGGLQTSGQTLRLPAAALTTLHALFNTLEPAGQLLLRWPDLVLDRHGPRPRVAGQTVLEAQWLQAGSALSRVVPLGNYRFTVQAGATLQDGFALHLQTAGGPLRLEGQGTWSAAGHLVFDGRAWADGAAPASTQSALRRLLDLLGPKAGPDGATPLRMRS